MSNPLPLTAKRRDVRRAIVEAAQGDPGIVAVVDYGSASEGREDEWSDLDIALFIRDGDLEAFEADWKAWASQFGSLLLAYVSGVGHPWVIYDAEPMPLRLDLAFHRESDVEISLTWPNTPESVAAMVLYDDTGGRLSGCVERIVGQSLAPSDLHRTFDQVCGDLWYYLLRSHVRILRGELWAARHDYGFIIIGNLLALLRLEMGAVERWRGANASAGIEKALPVHRLGRLERCIPGRSEAELRQALLEAALLGQEAAAATAAQHGWDWPEALARRTVSILQAAAPDR
jgi:hypothetical protein